MSEQKPPVQGIHHIAFGTRSARDTYEYYNNKLGFPLVHCENHQHGDGYFRHFFFDMGMGQELGFFAIHNVGEKEDYRTDPSTGLGMPPWVNHVSFRMPDEKSWTSFRDHVKAQGIRVLGEVDHDFCFSFYLMDPNGLMIEFTYDTAPERFGQGHDEAYRLLFEVPAEEIGDRKES